MEIPNYDVDKKNKKFKQLYSFMPNDTFRMLICGNSGSGKTNLLYHMLIEPLLYCDKIYLYAKNLAQENYQNLMKEMNEASEETGYNVMEVSNDKIIPITHLPYENNQKIVIFDDYVCEKNQREIVDYLKNRPKKTFIIFIFDISYCFFFLYNFWKRNIRSTFHWFIFNCVNFKSDNFFEIPT